MKKLFKRCLSFLLAAVMLAGMIPAIAPQADAAVLQTGYCGYEGSNLSWMLTDKGVLTIFGSGSAADYAKAGDAPWYSLREKINKVVIDNGVITIGNYAFADCENLTEVDFGDDMLRIGSYAFDDCVGLKTVDFPETLVTLCEGTFDGCTNLTGAYFYGGAPVISRASYAEPTFLADTVHLYYIPGTVGWTENAEDYNAANGTWKGYRLYVWDAMAPNCVVTFNSKGGSPVSKQIVAYGETASAPTAPTYAGYEFMGWFSDENFFNYYSFSTPVTSDLTLYAKWDAIYHKVTFEALNGNVMDDQSVAVQEGKKVSKPIDPTREGYEFTGWFVDEDCTTAYNFSTPVAGDLTLYAGWKELYTVSFDSKLGSVVASQFVADGGKVTKPADPTREGYLFGGWYTDEDFADTYDFTAPVTGSMTLYAKWVPDVMTYTVSFYSNGGSAVSSQTVAVGTAAVKPDDPTQAGCAFIGWYTDEALTIAYDFATPVTGNLALYAKWETAYTVTFVTNGGSAVDPIVVIKGEKCVKPADPNNPSYKLAGWYTDEALTEKYDFETPITGDITLYAKWTRVYYTVTFNTNGGTAVTSQKVIAGHMAVRPSEDPTYITDSHDFTYAFVDWYMDEELTMLYDFEKTPVNGDLTLYAGWEKACFVHFNLDYENKTLPSQTIPNGQKVTEPADPEREGYVFDYWYLIGTTDEYDFSKSVESGMTLMAKWKEKFTVTVDLQDGSEVTTYDIVDGEKFAEPAEPTREGYRFLGWYENAVPAEGEAEYDFNTPVTADITLYACWHRFYTVTFASNGGTAVGAKQVLEGEQVGEPDAPTSDGYAFLYWCSDEGLQIPYNFDTPVTADITLYAKWNTGYVVTFDSNGGSDVPVQIVAKNAVVVEPATAPTREGYVFSGWYLDDVEYDFTKPVTKAITLTAKWVVLYTVTFVSNGSPVDPVEVEAGKPVAKPTDPTSEGDAFVGWYTDKQLNKPYNFDTPVLSDITLYGKWALAFTVSFDSNGGDAVASQTVAENAVAKEPEAPKYEKHEFAGWYLGEAEYDFNTPVTKDITLTAKWTPLWTVTFDVKGGTPVDIQVLKSGETATEPDAPVLENHQFAGWYIGDAKYDFTTPVTVDITLTAKWLRTFKVTFVNNVDDNLVEQYVVEGTPVTRPADPESEGLAFGGWYTNASLTRPYDFSTLVTGDMTLYAKWGEACIVTFDSMGGSTVEPVTVAEGCPVAMPATAPTRPLYNFLGWYADAECTVEYNFSSKVTGNMTLYAKWEAAETYEVVFDTNGGEAVETQYIVVGPEAKAVEPEKAPEYPGYVFLGWYADEALTVPYDFSQILTEDITLYAAWAKACTVTFDTNGGTPAVDDQILALGARATEPAKPALDGYVFEAWYLGEEVYDFSKPVVTDITLTAKWKATYTVTFDTNGSTTVVPSQIITDGELAIDPSTIPVLEGHTFDAWYLGEERYDFATPVTADIVLTAKWNVSYVVKFDTNGGSAVGDKTVLAGEKVQKPADPEYAPNALVGWYVDEALTEPYNFEAPVHANMTLYAKWAVARTVSFQPNGGSDVAAQTVPNGTAAKEPTAPTYEGYVFMGWFTDEALTSAYEFTAPVTESFTLYAKWEAEPTFYTVTFVTNGGSEVDEQIVVNGETATKPADPTLEGQVFVGWFSDEALTQAYDFTASVTDDITLYAKWAIDVPTTFTVTFDSNGGSAVEAQTVAANGVATKPADPTKDQRVLEGWLLNGEPYDFATPVTGDITLVADWMELRASSAALVPNDMIQIRYTFKISETDITKFGMLVFSDLADAEAHDFAKANENVELVLEDDSYRGYTAGIAAKDMANSQFVIGYAELADGTYAFGNIVEYSPLTYATRQTDSTSTAKAETKALCHALMQYGAAAQVALGGQTTGLMNEGFEEVPYDASVLGAEVFAVDTTVTNGMSIKAASLALEGAISYRIRIANTSGKTVYLEYTLMGETVDGVELVREGLDDYGYIAGVAARDMDETITIRPYYLNDNGEKVYGAELVYSGYEYTRRTVAGNGSANAKALAKALAMYIDAANTALS